MKLIIDIPKKWFYDMVRENFKEVDELCAVIQHSKIIPDNATNGDVIKEMFPQLEILGTIMIKERKIVVKLYPEDDTHDFDLEWWNAPYQKGGKE